MLASSLPLLVVLAQAAAIAIAIPLLATGQGSPSALSARSQICGNRPNTVAGTRFEPRTTFKPRVIPIPCPRCGITWCGPGTATYLIIKTGWAANNIYFLRDLVAASLQAADYYITTGGDRIITSASGTSFHTREGLTLEVANANNHQLTWGVLIQALMVLDDFIRENGGFVSATFDIFDGRNQVATGNIQ